MKNNFLSSTMLILLAFGLTLTSCGGGGLIGLMNGPSKAQLEAIAKIRSAPNIEAVEGLENKLIWLQGNAQSGGSYVIELNSDDKIIEENNVFKFKNNITITLKGIGINRTISSRNPFVLDTNITLVLDNITIKNEESTHLGFITTKSGGVKVIVVGGTLIMNEGSIITGGYVGGYGGGIQVYSGTFLMKGGTISGNISKRAISYYHSNSEHGKNPLKHSTLMNPNSELGGGGVYVSGNGTFIKTGGTIKDNLVKDVKRELYSGYREGYKEEEIKLRSSPNDDDYEPVFGFGSQIYFDGPNKKTIDTPVGPEYSFYFSNGTFKEGRYEEPVTQPVAEPIAEPEKYGIKEIQDTVQNAPQEVPVTPQEALQEYQAAMQKMKATQQAALLEYQATVQTNPAAQQEAMRKYQKTLQDAQQEMQKAVEKYREALQKKQ